ncbi:MAG: hypothetical protein P8Y99_05525 [Calditrichaceae bacterium]
MMWSDKFLIIGFVLFFSGCTDNPFFDDKIDIKENYLIKGQVGLDQDITLSGIYIWLEGINLSDWTDEFGNFEIELPVAESQAGGGLNGIYKLFIYTANYQFKEYDLLIINGEFEYGTQTLDEKGNFKHKIILKKLLDIQTTIVPNQIVTTNKDPINFTIRLESLVDSVIVQTHFNNWNAASSLVFLEQNSPIEEAILIQGNPAILSTTVIKDIVYWPTSFVFSSNFFNTGIYQVNPYIRIIQEGLPDELLLSIDEEIFAINYHYLYWPIKMRTGLLTVIDLD